MDELVRIKDEEEDKEKNISFPDDSKMLDWWDINYRPPDYHTEEELSIFYPIQHKK
jgi:hypothetical protein